MPTEALGIRSRALAQERQNSFLGAGRLVKSPGLLSIQDGFPLPHVVGKFLKRSLLRLASAKETVLLSA